MLVKQLVGNLAGHIIDLRLPEAQSCIDMGTAMKPTEAELEAYAQGDDGPYEPEAKPKRAPKAAAAVADAPVVDAVAPAPAAEPTAAAGDAQGA